MKKSLLDEKGDFHYEFEVETGVYINQIKFRI